MTRPRILLTGVTGRLGPLILDRLLESLPAAELACLVRPSAGQAAARLAERGVAVRHGDYDDPASLAPALAGIERLMLVSGSQLGVRVRQHADVIAAAGAAGVGFIAYTSILHADRSTISVAEDHRRTEALLAAAGIPHALLRNGWYSENLTALIPAALGPHELVGAAGDGRIASAERRDFADGAAAVILDAEHQAGRVHECAGDEGYTLAEFAAIAGRAAGTTIRYRNLSEGDYDAVLRADGAPPAVAALMATSHTAIATGDLFDDGRELGRLIGRPTRPIAATVAAALASA